MANVRTSFLKDQNISISDIKVEFIISQTEFKILVRRNGKKIPHKIVRRSVPDRNTGGDWVTLLDSRNIDNLIEEIGQQRIALSKNLKADKSTGNISGWRSRMARRDCHALDLLSNFLHTNVPHILVRTWPEETKSGIDFTPPNNICIEIFNVRFQYVGWCYALYRNRYKSQYRTVEFKISQFHLDVSPHYGHSISKGRQIPKRSKNHCRVEKVSTRPCVNQVKEFFSLDFYSRVREFRKIKGWTTQQLADRANIGETMVRNYESRMVDWRYLPDAARRVDNVIRSTLMMEG